MEFTFDNIPALAETFSSLPGTLKFLDGKDSSPLLASKERDLLNSIPESRLPTISHNTVAKITSHVNWNKFRFHEVDGSVVVLKRKRNSRCFFCWRKRKHLKIPLYVILDVKTGVVYHKCPLSKKRFPRN